MHVHRAQCLRFQRRRSGNDRARSGYAFDIPFIQGTEMRGSDEVRARAAHANGEMKRKG
jgi:hypothetical protein